MAELSLSSTGVFLLVIWLMSMVFVYILVVVIPYSAVLYSTLNGGDWKDGDALGLCLYVLIFLLSCTGYIVVNVPCTATYLPVSVDGYAATTPVDVCFLLFSLSDWINSLLDNRGACSLFLDFV
ncbi:hypothetical protein D5086_001616 [Populus alba]|uniref:Uncharacterized protein n=1 Tax=Populus alba TaxID=43335 RepID=A0ACC4D1H0_POPAL